MTEARLRYRPGILMYPSPVFVRATIANYTDEVADLALHYWPGQLHLAETFTRATTANYTSETRYPSST